MAITTNLDDAIIEDGQYLASVVTANEDVSQSSGNDMIVLSLGIVGGKHGGKPLPKDYLVFSTGGLPRVAATIKALGVVIPAGTFSLDAQTLVGKKALVTLKTIHEEAKNGYEARDVLKIIRYDPAPIAAADAAVDAALPAAAKLPDDDIPF